MSEEKSPGEKLGEALVELVESIGTAAKKFENLIEVIDFAVSDEVKEDMNKVKGPTIE